MNVPEFKKLPILGILRGVAPGAIVPLTGAIIEAGLKAVEITMNTPRAPELIATMTKTARGRLTVGAGTVTDVDLLDAALDAGASFIVMPAVVDDVVETCVRKRIPVFPGALTPTEVYSAWRAGAAMVKVFPAGVFGPSYFRELKGPFNDVELMATGGVTSANMRDYFSAGASAVSFGASVFRKDWLARNDYASITSSIRAFVDAYPAR